MGKAWVYTDAIERFAKSTNHVEETVTNSGVIDYQVDQIQNDIQGALRVLYAQLQDCMSAETRIAEISARLQREYDELNSRCQELLSCEPEHPVEITVPAEYDEDGKMISPSYKDYGESPEHAEWRLEYEQVSKQRDIKAAELSQASSLRDEIRLQIQKLNDAIQMLEAIMAKNKECYQRIHAIKNHITDDSKYAFMQLKKAIAALNEYLSEQIAISGPTHKAEHSGDSHAPTVDTKDNNSPKRYGSPVIVEIEITMGRKKKIVHIKRQVYQYYEEIDFDYIRKDGLSNRQAMLEGKPPVVIYQGKEDVLELHHLTQVENNNDPVAKFPQGGLVEIRSALHDKYTKILHFKYPKEEGVLRSFRVTKNPDHTHSKSDDGRQFVAFRKKYYWQARVLEHDRMAKE